MIRLPPVTIRTHPTGEAVQSSSTGPNFSMATRVTEKMAKQTSRQMILWDVRPPSLAQRDHRLAL